MVSEIEFFGMLGKMTKVEPAQMSGETRFARGFGRYIPDDVLYLRPARAHERHERVLRRRERVRYVGRSACLDAAVEGGCGGLNHPSHPLRKETIVFEASFVLGEDGAALRVHRYGSGPLVVLVHGSCVDSEFFDPLARELSRRFTVVSYDRRGLRRER